MKSSRLPQTALRVMGAPQVVFLAAFIARLRVLSQLLPAQEWTRFYRYNEPVSHCLGIGFGLRIQHAVAKHSHSAYGTAASALSFSSSGNLQIRRGLQSLVVMDRGRPECGVLSSHCGIDSAHSEA